MDSVAQDNEAKYILQRDKRLQGSYVISRGAFGSTLWQKKVCVSLDGNIKPGTEAQFHTRTCIRYGKEMLCWSPTQQQGMDSVAQDNEAK
jgi:hypothetical protein